MLINDTQQKRLRLFAMAKFGKIKDFAEAMGMTSQGINPYITDGGRVLQRNEHREKLKDLGLNLDWYYYGTGEMLNNKGANDNLFDNLKSNVRPMTQDELKEKKEGYNTYVRFKQASIPLNSGLSDSYNIYTDTTRMISLSQDALGFAVSGDEMFPSLRHGDFVFAEPQKEINVGSDAIFSFNGFIICRYVKEIKENTIVISAYNPDFPDLEVDKTSYLGSTTYVERAAF